MHHLRPAIYKVYKFEMAVPEHTTSTPVIVSDAQLTSGFMQSIMLMPAWPVPYDLTKPPMVRAL